MTCPFIDSECCQCSKHLNMQNLDEAFELCNDHYLLCPVYIELTLAVAKTAACASDSARVKVQA